MALLIEALKEVAAALDRGQVDYALCGALALAIYGFPRATMDIDMLIRGEDLKRAENSVAKVGFTLTAGIIPFNVGKATRTEVARVSRAVGEDLVTLDLILVSEALEPVWRTRSPRRIDDMAISVISREGLILMKTLSPRAKDRNDLITLQGGDDE